MLSDLSKSWYDIQSSHGPCGHFSSIKLKCSLVSCDLVGCGHMTGHLLGHVISDNTAKESVQVGKVEHAF